MVLRWAPHRLDDAAWIAERVTTFAVDLRSVVPDVFEAYARVFHPVDGRPWAAHAAENRRVPHPDMQHHLVTTPPGGEAPPYMDGVDVGSLPEAELRALVQVLLARGGDVPCLLAVWDGYGHLQGGGAVSTATSDGRGGRLDGLAPPEVRRGPVLELPNRAYLLLEATLAEVPDVAAELWHQSPNLWWPDDRAWLVATEIDHAWTYVGGPADLIGDVVHDPGLEAMRVQPTHRFTVDADLLNEALG